MAPVRVAIVNDYEIVVAGVAGLLAPFGDRIEIVEMTTSTGVITPVDVVLYDTFGGVQGGGTDLDSLVEESEARVVVFSWSVERELVDRALERGAWGYLSKGLTGEEIAKAVEGVHAGQVVTLPMPADEAAEALAGSWPGRQHGLTHRESEVLALITQGLTNQEIADRAYISINSVKTYVRTAYRKIGATRRSQAVRWGMENGFAPDRGRVVVDR